MAYFSLPQRTWLLVPPNESVQSPKKIIGQNGRKSATTFSIVERLRNNVSEDRLYCILCDKGHRVKQEWPVTPEADEGASRR